MKDKITYTTLRLHPFPLLWALYDSVRFFFFKKNTSDRHQCWKVWITSTFFCESSCYFWAGSQCSDIFFQIFSKVFLNLVFGYVHLLVWVWSAAQLFHSVPEPEPWFPLWYRPTTETHWYTGFFFWCTRIFRPCFNGWMKIDTRRYFQKKNLNFQSLMNTGWQCIILSHAYWTMLF